MTADHLITLPQPLESIDKICAALGPAVRHPLIQWSETLDNANATADVFIETRRYHGKKCLLLSMEGDYMPITPDPAVNNIKYSYKNKTRTNRIFILPETKKINQILPGVTAIILGIIVGLAMRSLPSEITGPLSTDIISPALSAIIGLLTTVAIPMIFITLIHGILQINNSSAVGTISKKTILRYAWRLLLVAFVTIVLAFPHLPITTGTGATDLSAASTLYALFLSIIPTDVFTPFINRNVLQVLFMSIVCGLAIIALSKRVPAIIALVSQINEIILLLMKWVCLILPLFIFLTLANLMLAEDISNLYEYIYLFVLIAGSIMVNSALMVGEVCISKNIAPFKLIKKLSPAILVSLSTASSTASYPKNLETCRNMGVEQNLSNFAIPFGSMILRSGNVVGLLSISIVFGVVADVSITYLWLAIAVVLSIIMAVAAPSVPGGEIVACAVLFPALGIPFDTVLLAAAAYRIIIYMISPLTSLTADLDLVQIAGKLKLLNTEKLRE